MSSRFLLLLTGGWVALILAGGLVVLRAPPSLSPKPYLKAELQRMGFMVDQVVEIEDSENQSFDLLVPGRKIPKSSTKITAHVMQFQDATRYKVKFDVPVADARAFMVQIVGADGAACLRWPTTKDLKGWPAQRPEGGICRQDRRRVSKEARQITIAIVPNGAMATVLVDTAL